MSRDLEPVPPARAPIGELGDGGVPELEIIRAGEDVESEEAVEINGRRLTAKQVAFVGFLAQGMDDVEAARAAGYKNPFSAAQSLRVTLGQAAYNSLLFAGTGLTLQSAMRKLKELTEATQTFRMMDKEGKVREFVDPDNRTRTEAIKTVLFFHGAKPPTKSEVQIESRQSIEATLTVGTQKPIEEMTDEELLEKMRSRQMARVAGVAGRK